MAKRSVCPRCGSSKVRRSHRRGMAERLKTLFLGLQPYRCLECKKRYIARSSDPRHWPWATIVLMVVALAAAVFWASRPADQPSAPPPADQGGKVPQAEQTRTTPSAAKPSGQQPAPKDSPKTKAGLSPETEQILKALGKAPPPPPPVPQPPPPRSSVKVPPVRPGYAVVPALVGYPKSYAQWVLAKRRLKYLGLLHGPARGKPNGQVFAQEPEPGAVVPLGTEVKVRSYVAPKEERIVRKRKVPDLKGLYQDAAEDALRREGFTPRYMRIGVKDNRWHGRVAGQSPAAGTELAQGSPVEVSLFDAAPLREMPFLIGMPLSYAQWLLPRLGLPYRVSVHGPAPGKPHDGIFNQQPPPGVVVPQGLLVQLHVYQAPPKERKPSQLVVPDVRGFSYLLAEDALRRLGLSPLYNLVPGPDPANYGLVVHQEPLGGATLETGGQVMLTVLGPKKENLGRGTTVPFLVGLPLSYAKWALARRGLKIHETLAGPARGKRDLMVFMQNPPPGQPVPTGTTVRIKAYKAPKDEADQQMTVVPELSGLSQALAEEMARKSDLVPRFAKVPNPDPRWRGLVESQEPAAGQKVLPESEVLVRINN